MSKSTMTSGGFQGPIIYNLFRIASHQGGIHYIDETQTQEDIHKIIIIIVGVDIASVITGYLWGFSRYALCKRLSFDIIKETRKDDCDEMDKIISSKFYLATICFSLITWIINYKL
jgi:hypothetical protein